MVLNVPQLLAADDLGGHAGLVGTVLTHAVELADDSLPVEVGASDESAVGRAQLVL
ncbi:hypothetical protein G6038_24395 [Rhodococcus sp. 14C212]|uniref:hypothetical protein n=1 Tax=Rhodococcus sp. 14C212 TaxID=2711209 RepID=UPI0013EA5CA6|nr:hypothetical protein [Rhodococcus sp. 14C212]NGP08560.1 hypothetical protein [Rhodococcus sp. 14C212]